VIASVVIAGIVRCYFIIYLMNGTYDNTWYLYKTWTWTVVELDIAIAAASAPALKPFFRRFFVEPLTSQPNRQQGSHGRDPASYPAATRGVAMPSLLSSVDEEKGDGSWSNNGSTWQGPGEGEVRMGMALGRHGGDGLEPYEVKTLSGSGDKAVEVSLVRPIRPLSMHPVSGAGPRANSFPDAWQSESMPAGCDP